MRRRRDPPSRRGTGNERIDPDAGFVWRYIRRYSQKSRGVPGPAPNLRDGAPGAAESIAAADHRLIHDFLAGRAGAADAMAARLAIIPRILMGLCRRFGFPLKAHDLEDTA